MTYTGIPTWAWGFIALTMVPTLFALILLFLRDATMSKPVRRVKRGDTTVELWTRDWARPPAGEALIVPVGTDLRMTTGIAKWARDTTANRLAAEAEAAAPLQPGQAWAGQGGKFRFRIASLAVVTDESKRTSEEWIAQGVNSAIQEARSQGARTCVVPDFTDDLLRQPKDITDAQRRETCGPIARAIVNGILASGDTMEEVRIWVWRKVDEDIYAEEMDRLATSEDISVTTELPVTT